MKKRTSFWLAHLFSQRFFRAILGVGVTARHSSPRGSTRRCGSTGRPRRCYTQRHRLCRRGGGDHSWSRCRCSGRYVPSPHRFGRTLLFPVPRHFVHPPSLPRASPPTRPGSDSDVSPLQSTTSPPVPHSSRSWASRSFPRTHNTMSPLVSAGPCTRALIRTSGKMAIGGDPRTRLRRR